MKTAPRGFPWGGCGHIPLHAYPATTLPAWVAGNCDAGFICPGRFGAWRVVMYPWLADGENRTIVFSAHFVVRCRWRCPDDGAGYRRAPRAIGGVRLAV